VSELKNGGSLKTSEKGIWVVRGSGWKIHIPGGSDDDPLELATSAIEAKWRTEGTGRIGSIMTVQFGDGDKIAVDSALVLANAGFHSEATIVDEGGG
jgi:hypothetical protein